MVVPRARSARKPRLVGGIARSASGGADQCCVRTSAAHSRHGGRAVQRLVEREPLAIGGIQAGAFLQPFTLALVEQPPSLRRPLAYFLRFNPIRHLVYRRIHPKPGKIGGDLGALGVSERLAERAEPGALAHAASRTSGSVRPSGSTVVFARAM